MLSHPRIHTHDINVSTRERRTYTHIKRTNTSKYALYTVYLYDGENINPHAASPPKSPNHQTRQKRTMCVHTHT